MSLRTKTKTACDIAQIDPLRFNDVVHAGDYPCAPETRPGSARIFTIDEVVALCLYSKMLRLSLSPKRAGHVACEAQALFAGRDHVTKVTYMVMNNGAWHIIDSSSEKTLPVFCLHFDIAELRKYVLNHLEDALKNQVVGD